MWKGARNRNSFRSRMTQPGGLESHHACNHPNIRLPPVGTGAGTTHLHLLRLSSSQSRFGDRSSWLSYRIACDQVSAACISKSLLYTQPYTSKYKCRTKTNSHKMYKSPSTHHPKSASAWHSELTVPCYLPQSSDEPVASHDPPLAYQSHSLAEHTESLSTFPTASQGLRFGCRSSVE